jgi:tRNA modification GTPase
MVESNETIVATATAPGRGGIGIVRISGPSAFQIGHHLFRPHQAEDLVARRLTYGWIVEPENDRVIDEVLAVFMPGPRSYTGEDVFEIQAHGGPILAERLIEMCQDMGARLARPGEFTLRAFLAGRIDLTQAESVVDLVGARTRTAAQLAAAGLAGALSQPCLSVHQAAVSILAEVEAGIDFPEEDLDLFNSTDLAEKIEAEVLPPLDQLIRMAEIGPSLREGARVVLVGRPNVGKSSLLNALLSRRRALVTDVPGTTRDYLEEVLDLDGLPVVLTDTAGLGRMNSGDQAKPEKAGMEATRQLIDLADLILLVLDAAEGFRSADQALVKKEKLFKLLVVANKADLVTAAEAVAVSSSLNGVGGVVVSAKTGQGLPDLRDALRNRLVAGFPEPRELNCLPTARQKEALTLAREAFRSASAGLIQGRPVELSAVDLKEGLDHLDRVTGRTAPQEVIDQIFSRFCIGK